MEVLVLYVKKNVTSITHVLGGLSVWGFFVLLRRNFWKTLPVFGLEGSRKEDARGLASQDRHSLGLFLPGTRVNIVRIDQTQVQQAK